MLLAWQCKGPRPAARWCAVGLGLGGCAAKSGDETGITAVSRGGCPPLGQPEELGVVDESALTEASGLAASGRHAGVFWTHNDDGDDDGLLYAVDETGAARGSLRISGAEPEDWEAVASDGAGVLVVGDIGDNDRSRETIRLWTVTEPAELDTAATAAVATPTVLRWPDVPRDAEAMVVDPETGRPVVFSREPGRAVLLRAPAAGEEGEIIGELSLMEGVLADSGEVRGADLVPGEGVWVRTDEAVAWFDWAGSLAETLAATGCAAPSPPEADGEAIAAWNGGFVTLGEGAAPVLWGVAEALLR